ncbi:TerD family protein [Clostridium estertheticum]|uniref:TerD family protein n=1 Tax=Clostridium estertheticum TaxID=238834 RepID=UPI0013E99B2C|nr:TerD family protein [Clostridium estertheticum]MBZ9687000.1 TerD family protein [Clostridium estertheticum]
MTINLKKGQKVDLTKGNSGISKIVVGLGWDAVASSAGGGLFKKKASDIDCDASVLMINSDGKLKGIENVIYFGNLESRCGGVVHTGDNRTGDGNGDDEQILIDLSKISEGVDKLVFVVNIYDCIKRNQDFGQIQNAYIRIVNTTDNTELLKYNLSESYAGKTSLITGDIYRHNNEWKFSAIGEGTNEGSLTGLIERYRK